MLVVSQPRHIFIQPTRACRCLTSQCVLRWDTGRSVDIPRAITAPTMGIHLVALATLGSVGRVYRGSRRSWVMRCATEDDAGAMTESDAKQMLKEAQRRCKLVLDSQGVGSPDWKAKVEGLRDQANNPNLWDDPASAQQVLQELQRFESAERRAERWAQSDEDVQAGLQLGAEDPEFLEEAVKALTSWTSEIDKAEIEVLMAGKYDSAGVTMTIRAGAGGDEACDWVTMLENMYKRYCESNGWSLKRLDWMDGDVLGLKYVDLEIQGEYAYGSLRAEHGTHRLVRVWNGKRQTTFAGVDVMPVLPDDLVEKIEIVERDLEFATFRSGGKGGQNVNKVETGVRIKHVPTGVVVKCTEERSQLMNKYKAMKMLKQKLLAIQEQQNAEAIDAIRGDLVEAAWGSQVRNYVLQPYTMVKDLRSGHERGDAGRVLDGDLGSHIDALIRTRAQAEAAS